MSFKIELEDLTGFAFSILRKHKVQDDFISFTLLERYGDEVVRNLQEKGFEAYLHLNGYLTDYFFQQYSDFCIPMTVNGEKGVALLRHPDRTSIMQKFHLGALPLDMFMAFISERPCSILTKNLTKA